MKSKNAKPMMNAKMNDSDKVRVVGDNAISGAFSQSAVSQSDERRGIDTENVPLLNEATKSNTWAIMKLLEQKLYTST